MLENKAPLQAINLNVIREELQLLRGAPTVTGKPTWVVFDPVQHRYFEIDFEVFEVLSLWNRSKTSDVLISNAVEEQGRDLSLKRVAEIMEFTEQNNLSLEAGEGGWQVYNNRAERKQVSPLNWILHNYLFFKIPLVRPSAFLKTLLPYVNFLFTRTMLWISIIAGLIGLYLVSRQWDEFFSTFANFFSFEGAIAYILMLVVIKILHEMGHAMMATRFGCRVPTMGIAFMLMFPVLYTDVTDSWRLRSRRQRLLIGGAGLLVELSIASFATLLWAFLPEGNLKSIAFMAATISWILSVVINLNPLMRFDGYYLLSDSLGIANLQSRGFAVGRWRMREWLFGLKLPPPEPLPARTLTILTVFAWAVWIYRFFLFLGIALVVYAYFFKVLGLFLFAVEIIWFIARPLWSELKEWFAMKKQIFSHVRVFLSLGVVAVLGALVVLPLSGRIDVPVVVEPLVYERLFPPSASRLVAMSVSNGQHVAKGDVLFRFASSQLEQEIRLNEIKNGLVRQRLARVVADKQEKSKYLILQQDLAAIYTQREGLKKQTERLIFRAPISGVVRDLNSNLHIGRWVKNSEHLATISAGKTFVAKGYLRERDLWRVKTGDKGKFIPDDFLVRQTRVNIKEISQAGARQLELLPLTSVYGGRVSARKDAAGKIVPVGATYKVTMSFQAMPDDTSKITRGIVQIDGIAESVAARIWRQVLRVLVRESGA